MSEPEDLFVATELGQIRALTDPLRQRILGEFARQALTTKQVALRLNEKPTKLYHHVAILENAGLLKLVETKAKRGTTEKYYRAVARQFAVGSSIGAEGASAVETWFTSAFAEASTHLRQAVKTGALDGRGERGKTMLASGQLYFSKEELAAFREQFSKIITDLSGRKKKSGNCYRFLFTLYPDAEPVEGDSE